MSDFKWGKLSVYTNDDHLTIYYWVKMKMYVVRCTLNRDNSLCVACDNGKLLPSMFWHHLGEQSDKIITYLMLKRK